MTTLLDSMLDAECDFSKEISIDLLAVNDVIDSYCCRLVNHFRDAWIVRFFVLFKTACISTDTNVVAKVEFLRIREYSQLKVDFTEQD